MVTDEHTSKIGNPDAGTDLKVKGGMKSHSEVSNYMQNLRLTDTGTIPIDNKHNNEDSLLSDSKTVVRFSPIWKQTLAASAPILLTFTSGLTTGFSAILLPQLKAGGPIPGDEHTASWIASMAALPMALGCLISGWLMERFGRKTSQYIICVPLVLGWTLITFAANLTLMLAGRFFSGLCIGLLGPLCPVFIGETTEPKYRGFFLAGVSLAIAVGIIFAHLVGTFVSWRITAAICGMFPILVILLLMVTPESPTWLISKERVQEGIEAFGWLRGYSHEANAELRALVDKQMAADQEPIATWKDKLAYFKSPLLLKPLLIMIVFFVTCQFSGVNAVAFYSIDIVEKAVGTGIDHYLAMLVIDSIRVAMSIVACVVCKQYSRRPLCFISGIFTSLSMISLSLFLYLTNGKATDMAWIPLTCLSVYICAISIGLVPLPWMMCGELFPTKVRGLGSGLCSAVAFLSFFVVVKTSPSMMSNLGEVTTFLFYGLVALFGTFALFFILPETKGKSLQEIEDQFRSNNCKDDTKG